MNKELQYWSDFYKKQNQPFQESLFASYCMTQWLKPKMTLLELGCGNGRDALYLSKCGVNVLAVDQCAEEIDFLNNRFGGKNISFKCADFSDLKFRKKFDAIYSRFTLHAISKQQEIRTLNWCARHLNENGLLLIEARGIQNEIYGMGERVADEADAFIYEGHYRRFLNADDVNKQITGLGLTILSSDEAANRAPFNGTNYKFLRIVAQKQQSEKSK